ncbi:MAG: M1 family peptidase, partial [Christiangramia sp.]
MIDKTFLKTCLLLIGALILQNNAFSQEYTHADTLRGSITPERAWWDVMRYDISVTPDFDKKYTAGYNNITYK